MKRVFGVLLVFAMLFVAISFAEEEDPFGFYGPIASYSSTVKIQTPKKLFSNKIYNNILAQMAVGIGRACGELFPFEVDYEDDISAIVAFVPGETNALWFFIRNAIDTNFYTSVLDFSTGDVWLATADGTVYSIDHMYSAIERTFQTNYRELTAANMTFAYNELYAVIDAMKSK